MNLYESIKKNLNESKGETYKLVHADSDKISELEKGSAFTWEGMDISDKNLKDIIDFFTKNTQGFKTPVTMYNWTGKEFNEKYGLTGSNAYPDDLNFLSIPLDTWSEQGNLPIVKMQVGARWLDDIVDNNARREGKYEEELDEAANPEKKKKNKIIRDALKGPKSYNKNLKALQKMGINKNSKEMSEDDYGQTIYLHGPNGRHVSVDPDGTNVWSTFSTRDEDHYKKELDFKNRNSSNYNNQEHLDFNGKRAKAFDYYNYLHKPENDYQNEVDKANKVKDYRDNEDKTGYNLPDEALTPEEKSLNRRPRKYVQLSKDRKELEDELAGYDETKKQLDKVNRKIKKLHNK